MTSSVDDLGGTAFERAEATLAERIRRRVRCTNEAEARVLVVAGPPGAGKTSVIRALADRGIRVHLERPEENPFLLGLLAGDASVAYHCQDWFVSAVESFIAGASRQCSIGIDQDPSATALVYGRGLLERGLLADAEGVEVVKRLQAVEGSLAEWPCCRVVLLDAPFAVLEERVVWRGAERPESFWLNELHQRFLSFGAAFGWPRIDTSTRTLAEVAQDVLDLGRGRS